MSGIWQLGFDLLWHSLVESLTSSVPFVAPAVDPDFLSSDFEAIVRYLLRSTQRFVWPKVFMGHVLEPASAFGGTTTDEELDTHASAISGT
jgi:hypothetical protein